MSFLSSVESIGNWFHKEQDAVGVVFTRIEPLVLKAEPVVQDLSNVVAMVAGLEKNAILTKISGYLVVVSGDEAKVDAFITANENAPLNNIMHNAAVFLLTLQLGPTADTIISDLDLAVQTAYSVAKQSGLAKHAPTVTV